MTKKDFEKLGKRLSCELPGFTAKGQLLLITPVHHTLRAVCFDGSTFDTNLFFVHVFLQPLFVPATHIGLNLGWRVGGGSYRWDIRSPDMPTALASALKHEALPFLSRAETAEDVAIAVESLHKSADPQAQQAVAYAWARAENIERSAENLGRLIRSLDQSIPWQREMAARAEMLRTKLADLREARHQLETWENETAKNLGLDPLRR